MSTSKSKCSDFQVHLYSNSKGILTEGKPLLIMKEISKSLSELCRPNGRNLLPKHTCNAVFLFLLSVDHKPQGSLSLEELYLPLTELPYLLDDQLELQLPPQVFLNLSAD